MARLEGAYDQVSQRLMNIDPRFDGIDRKIDLCFDALDAKIDALDAKIDQRIDALEVKLDTKWDRRFTAIDKKVDRNLMWTIGVIVTLWLATNAPTYLHH